MHVFKLPTFVFSIHLGNCVDCLGGLQSLDPELVTWLFTGGQNVSIFSKKKEKEIHQVGHKAFIFTFTSDLNYVFPKPLKTNET